MCLYQGVERQRQEERELCEDGGSELVGGGMQVYLYSFPGAIGTRLTESHLLLHHSPYRIHVMTEGAKKYPVYTECV